MLDTFRPLFLTPQAAALFAACNVQAWVQPMTVREYQRLAELSSVQAGIAALADAMPGARPPAAAAAPDTKPAAALLSAPVDRADAAQAMRDAGLLDASLGSNAWAFG